MIYIQSVYLIFSGASLMLLITVSFLSLAVCSLRGRSGATDGFLGVLRKSSMTRLLPCSSNFFFSEGAETGASFF